MRLPLPNFAPDDAAAAPAAAPSTPAASEPSSAPASAEPAASETGASSAPVDEFSQLGLPDDEGSESVELASEPEAPAAEVKPVTPPEVAPVASPAAKPAEPKAAAPPAVVAPKEPAAAAAPPPSEPQSLNEQLTQHREALIDGLAKERFSLTPEETSALETDAVQAIPRLLARVYYESVRATLNHLQSHVPPMVGNFLKMKEAQTEAETAFYGRFPALNKKAHGMDVNQFAHAFRQQNPSVSADDLMSMIGAAVMAKHQIPMVAPAAQGTSGTLVNGIPKPASPPFVPARSGATVTMTPEAASPFAGLGQDFED